MALFCSRRHRHVRDAIGQQQRNLIRTYTVCLQVSAENFGTIDHSQLEQGMPTDAEKCPVNAS
ncbi:MAG: hypothetical protein GY820_13185 [Gammaproteobacteria bacterium]|nr:hypothetical protein [Gammaproteobacteria bacterium]